MFRPTIANKKYVPRSSSPSSFCHPLGRLPIFACNRLIPRAQVATRRQGTLKGGYVAKKEEGDLELIILAAGSEVQHAMAAADTLGKGVRVVSVPSMYRFDKQSAEYKEEVLPSSCTKRVAMEVSCVCFC